jgi:hypothetical protein
MNLIKFLFNKNCRNNIMKMFSEKIVMDTYYVEKEMEFIYGKTNVPSRNLAA